MRSWRNWQTRKTKDLVGNSMQVQFLSTAPQKRKSHRGFLFCFTKYSTGIAQAASFYAGSREKRPRVRVGDSLNQSVVSRQNLILLKKIR